MKKSLECEDIINEILEEIELYNLNERCVVFFDRESEEATDFLLQREFNETTDIYIDEKREFMTLFEALVLFIKQNSVIVRPEISYKLIAIRNIAGLTQSALAQKLGVDVRNYSAWEVGKRKPKLENLIKITNACGVDITCLL